VGGLNGGGIEDKDQAHEASRSTMVDSVKFHQGTSPKDEDCQHRKAENGRLKYHQHGARPQKAKIEYFLIFGKLMKSSFQRNKNHSIWIFL